MIQFNSLEHIRSGLSDAVEETTGIYIAPREFHVELNQDMMSIYVHQSHLCNLAVDPEDWNPEDIGWDLVDSMHDLRHRLVELKREEIGAWMEDDLSNIQEFLNRQLKGRELLLDLDIEICALDYERTHWQTEEEAEEGYPPLAVHVTDYEDFNFYHPINPYEPGKLFEPEKLFEELLVYIHEYNESHALSDSLEES